MKEFFNLVFPIGAVVVMSWICTQGCAYPSAVKANQLGSEIDRVTNVINCPDGTVYRSGSENKCQPV